MTIVLPPQVEANLENVREVFKTPYKWRAVTSYFSDEVPERSHTSNVHVVPFVGDNCVLVHTMESSWATPGGSLLENEEINTAIERELAEEIGGKPLRYELSGAWESSTTAEEAYRPCLPHPNFAM